MEYPARRMDESLRVCSASSLVFLTTISLGEPFAVGNIKA
jgi:hypothetical protein